MAHQILLLAPPSMLSPAAHLLNFPDITPILWNGLLEELRKALTLMQFYKVCKT